jgi:hypothetical protein
VHKEVHGGWRALPHPAELSLFSPPPLTGMTRGQQREVARAKNAARHDGKKAQEGNPIARRERYVLSFFVTNWPLREAVYVLRCYSGTASVYSTKPFDEHL